MTAGSPCTFEARVLAQRRTGADDPAVHAHLETCATCREAADVADFLLRVAATPDPHRLPEASRVWFRAQLVRKWDAERRATKPIETMHRAERGLLFVGLIVLVWMWTQADRWFGHASSQLAVVDTIVPRGFVLAVALVAAVAAIGSIFLWRGMVKD